MLPVYICPDNVPPVSQLYRKGKDSKRKPNKGWNTYSFILLAGKWMATYLPYFPGIPLFGTSAKRKAPKEWERQIIHSSNTTELGNLTKQHSINIHR